MYLSNYLPDYLFSLMLNTTQTGDVHEMTVDDRFVKMEDGSLLTLKEHRDKLNKRALKETQFRVQTKVEKKPCSCMGNKTKEMTSS